MGVSMNQEDGRFWLSRSELRWAVATGFVSGVLLGAVVFMLLARTTIGLPLVSALSFLAFSLPLYIPVKLIQSERAYQLNFRRFAAASVVGASIAWFVQFVFEKVS